MSSIELAISTRFKSLKLMFDEKNRRLWAAAEAQSAGKGGVSAVHRATGISRTTIHQGIRELNRQGHPISDRTVGRLLHEMGYSLQANCKTSEGKQHPDRNEQF